MTPASSGGWGPVTALAHLVARLWEAQLVEVHPTKDYSLPRKLASMLPRLRGRRGPLLVIAAHPGDLLALADARVLLGRFDQVGAWVIDSFWDERIPRFARERRTIDRVWVTDAELVERYATAMRVPVGWAPWGSDALGWPGSSARDVDVLRLGRQPAAWNDNEANRALFAERGLSYQGSFPGSQTDGLANQREVIRQLSRAKVVLASSNLASPADYTHRTRDYITARFTDAVTCGVRIAGQFPQVRAASLIPEAARVEVDVSTREAGIEAIAAAVGGWTESASLSLHAHALAALDWRHRVREISEELGVETPTLTQELSQLNAAIVEAGVPRD
ncbi:hypothetical protein ACPCG0_10505 [Propionibacteriaceae bacterium Y1923]|uniref:hypothetical protein n=1 Tax=Aestuariimicrobium sp. Y1814 TaxID=3418742 RepID=UPI003C171DE1